MNSLFPKLRKRSFTQEASAVWNYCPTSTYYIHSNFSSKAHSEGFFNYFFSQYTSMSIYVYLPNTHILLVNSSKGFFKNFYLGNLIFLKSSTRNSSKISSRFLSKKQISVRSSLIVSSKQPFSSREFFKRALNFLQIFNKEFFKNFFKIFYLETNISSIFYDLQRTSIVAFKILLRKVWGFIFNTWVSLLEETSFNSSQDFFLNDLSVLQDQILNLPSSYTKINLNDTLNKKENH